MWCFVALLAGALLLCTPLVLVQATADPDNAWLGPDPLTTPPAFAGDGWDAIVTVEAVARYDGSDLPPAVPLAPAKPDFAAWLTEAIPDLQLLAAAHAESESAVLSEGQVKQATPGPVQTAALDEALIAESSGASVTISAEPEPQPVAQEPAAETMHVAQLEKTQQAPEPVPEDMDVSEEPARGGGESTSSIKPLPGTLPDIAPPLPARRPPAPIKTAEIVVAQEAHERSPDAPSSRGGRRDETPPPRRWRPMALAPADADAPAKPKLSPPPAPKLSKSAYQSQIWSALARAKPRAGERGSATVTFSIGANGGLRGVRVAKSSGNAKIDRMALSTVRKAGPFPPPPGSGAASYTIRIDFH